MTTAYLTDDQFRARATAITPADVERLQGVSAKRLVGDVTAADITAETPLGVAEYDANVVAVKFTPDAVLAADAVNNATVNLYKRAADGTQTLIASLQTSALGWTAGIPVRLAISAAPVSADDTFTYAITKSGTGVVVPTGEFVVKLDSNFVTTRLVANTAYIEARLRKRYDVPFAAPVPEVVTRWLVDMTTKDCFDRRGRNPTSDQDQNAIDKPFDAAIADIKEAADAKDGLFDLPLRDDQRNVTGVTKGAPLSYSETSPYVSMDLQRKQARDEDASGTGTSQ